MRKKVGASEGVRAMGESGKGFSQRGRVKKESYKETASTRRGEETLRGKMRLPKNHRRDFQETGKRILRGGGALMGSGFVLRAQSKNR